MDPIPLRSSDRVLIVSQGKSSSSSTENVFIRQLVNTHVVFQVVPALLKFQRCKADEDLLFYKYNFKMFLNGKKLTDEQKLELYREYLPRLSSEITKRVLDILDKKFVSVESYMTNFTAKFMHIYDAFIKVDTPGCPLSEEESLSIHKKVALEMHETSRIRRNIHKAVRDFMNQFFLPYQKGVVNQKKALRRRPLMGYIGLFLKNHFGKVPYKEEYVKSLAVHYYLYECSQYILDQYENDLGVILSFAKSKEDEKYRMLFRICVEAVLEAMAIDFPDHSFTMATVSDYLDRLMRNNDRMKAVSDSFLL